MKDRHDLVRNWLRKAESDLAALDLALAAEAALDTACFHGQQAVERLLKAYLLSLNVDFPFTHNLSKLLALCQQHEPEFSSLAPLVEPLTPYAVELRYDVEFWPTVEQTREVRDAVLTVRCFVVARLPDAYTR